MIFIPSGNDTIFDETRYYEISSGIYCIVSHIVYDWYIILFILHLKTTQNFVKISAEWIAPNYSRNYVLFKHDLTITHLQRWIWQHIKFMLHSSFSICQAFWNFNYFFVSRFIDFPTSWYTKKVFKEEWNYPYINNDICLMFKSRNI